MCIPCMPPFAMHAHPPPFTMHAPPGNHACPSPQETMHAPPEQPRTPPWEQPRMPPREQPCTPPPGATMHTPPSNHTPPQSNHAHPPCGQTDACELITLPQTSFTGGNKSPRLHKKSIFFYFSFLLSFSQSAIVISY